MLFPSSPEAYKLFHDGTVALANVEANGIKIDTVYLEKAIRKTDKLINSLEDELRKDRIWRRWEKVFGNKAKLGSEDQLAHILFKELEYPCKIYTKGGKPSGSEANLLDIDEPFIHTFRRMNKLKTATGTFLHGIREGVGEDGILHPNFNLNIAASFRSSSSDPINFQNFPTRNEEQAKLVRSVFVARSDDYHIVEGDFGGVEVGVACCVNLDPRLIKDYTEGDMHRDMAMECYMLPKKEVTKKIRYCGKNMFVFPVFYGSYWVDCSRNLWEAIQRLGLITESGVPLYKHLKNMGIEGPGSFDANKDPLPRTFAHHIKQVEERFWNKRYKVYNEWKKSTWRSYQELGYSQLKTGFVCSRDSDGLPMNRKQVTNYQIQGPAFHLLLWVVTVMDRWLRKNKMKSMIIGQIHDSIVADVHKDELEAYCRKLKEIMTLGVREQFKWVIVPIGVEIEITPRGKTWYDKMKESDFFAQGA